MKISVSMAAKEFTSLSADQSFLQAEYETFFRSELEAKGVKTPFELDDEALKEFFAEISAKWKARKLALYKDGKIDDSKL